MGKKVIHILLLLLISLSCPSIYGQDKELFFDTYEWDFSSIKELDGAVSHVFYLMNNSSESVKITGAIPGCSCIMATYPKEEIKPGKMAPVEVFFTPSGASGKTYRTIDIVGPRGRKLGTLSIHADVTPTDESIQKRYPTVLSQSLYVSRSAVPFGYMAHGETLSKVIYLANASSQLYKIEIEQKGSMKLDVNTPEYLGSENEQAVLLTYTMPKDKAIDASYADTLWISINGVKASKPIVTSAICLEKAPASSSAPSLGIYPSQGELKKAYFSDYYTGTIEISNNGKSPLTIKTVEIEGDCESSVKSGTSIAPGSKVKLTVKSKTPKASLNLFTNDPQRPYRQIIFNTK